MLVLELALMVITENLQGYRLWRVFLCMSCTTLVASIFDV